MAGVSQLIPTPYGAMEYAIAGTGPPLLMIHGTGGGFDQGLTFAAAIMRRGHQIISPSRFGYLRSGYPADPSSEDQADAFVRLLDHLRIDRIPVAREASGIERGGRERRYDFKPFTGKSNGPIFGKA